MLEKVKRRLGLTDDLQDALLNDLIEEAETRLHAKIEDESTPEELQWIVVNVSVAAFNRIGSEGYERDQEEGKVIQFQADPFTVYQAEIDDYNRRVHAKPERKARFL